MGGVGGICLFVFCCCFFFFFFFVFFLFFVVVFFSFEMSFSPFLTTYRKFDSSIRDTFVSFKLLNVVFKRIISY